MSKPLHFESRGCCPIVYVVRWGDNYRSTYASLANAESTREIMGEDAYIERLMISDTSITPDATGMYRTF